MGFPRREYWSGLPFPSPGDLPDSRIDSASPALAGGFFTAEPPGKPLWTNIVGLVRNRAQLFYFPHICLFSLWICRLFLGRIFTSSLVCAECFVHVASPQWMLFWTSHNFGGSEMIFAAWDHWHVIPSLSLAAIFVIACYRWKSLQTKFASVIELTFHYCFRWCFVLQAKQHEVASPIF